MNPWQSIGSSRRMMPGMTGTEPVLSIATGLSGEPDEVVKRPFQSENEKQNGRSPSCSS